MPYEYCNICLEECEDDFFPDICLKACSCRYVIHSGCYSNWLTTSNMAYNCIICHKTRTHSDMAIILERMERAREKEAEEAEEAANVARAQICFKTVGGIVVFGATLAGGIPYGTMMFCAVFWKHLYDQTLV